MLYNGHASKASQTELAWSRPHIDAADEGEGASEVLILEKGEHDATDRAVDGSAASAKVRASNPSQRRIVQSNQEQLKQVIVILSWEVSSQHTV